MPIRRLHTETRYSEAVIHSGTVYLSGQLADDLSGDIRQQTRETLASIDRLLAEVGTDKTRLLSALIHLRDIDGDYAGMNEVWDAWVPAVPRQREPPSGPRCTRRRCASRSRSSPRCRTSPGPISNTAQAASAQERLVASSCCKY